MKKFDIQTKLNKIEIIILTIVVLGIVLGFYLFYKNFSYSIKCMGAEVFFIFFIVFGLIHTIYAIISNNDKRIYLSTIIIEEKTIKLVYKIVTKIVKIEQIQKDEIQEFYIEFYSTFKKENITVIIKKKNGETYIINNNEITNFLVSANHKIDFIFFLIKNKNEIPNLKFKYEIENEYQKNIMENYFMQENFVHNSVSYRKCVNPIVQEILSIISIIIFVIIIIKLIIDII